MSTLVSITIRSPILVSYAIPHKESKTLVDQTRRPSHKVDICSYFLTACQRCETVSSLPHGYIPWPPRGCDPGVFPFLEAIVNRCAFLVDGLSLYHSTLDRSRQRSLRRLATGDTDLVPALRAARRLDPTKDLVALQPYRRVNRELTRCADRALTIRVASYAQHQLPGG